LEIAIVAFGDRRSGDNSIAVDVVSRIDAADLPASIVILSGEEGPLKVLEGAGRYDGLIIVDSASMGEEPGTLRTFDLNDLVLASPARRVTLRGIDLDSELIFAHKYLSLPPTRVVCIETDGLSTPGGLGSDPAGIRKCLEAIRLAIGQLSGQSC
jgi:hydrogenase maturation protease